MRLNILANYLRLALRSDEVGLTSLVGLGGRRGVYDYMVNAVVKIDTEERIIFILLKLHHFLFSSVSHSSNDF